MDGIQAAVLSVKLRHLDAANEARRAHARLYDELLAEEPRVMRPLGSPIRTARLPHLRGPCARSRRRIAANGRPRALIVPFIILFPSIYKGLTGFLGMGPWFFPRGRALRSRVALFADIP
jgi:hypothetical protein